MLDKDTKRSKTTVKILNVKNRVCICGGKITRQEGRIKTVKTDTQAGRQ